MTRAEFNALPIGARIATRAGQSGTISAFPANAPGFALVVMADGPFMVGCGDTERAMTFNEFLIYVYKRHLDTPSWRYGQTVFNCLCDINPELAENIRGGAWDPFYTTELFLIDECLDHIERNW